MRSAYQDYWLITKPELIDENGVFGYSCAVKREVFARLLMANLRKPLDRAKIANRLANATILEAR